MKSSKDQNSNRDNETDQILHDDNVNNDTNNDGNILNFIWEEMQN
jgi:hypothetical protein